MAKIYINDFNLKAFVGTTEEERAKQQSIILNISLEYDSQKAIESDDLSLAVDYESIASEITKFVDSGSFNLLETLCNSIVTIIMGDPIIQRTTVRINKPAAIEKAKATIIELSASRN